MVGSRHVPQKGMPRIGVLVVCAVCSCCDAVFDELHSYAVPRQEWQLTPRGQVVRACLVGTVAACGVGAVIFRKELPLILEPGASNHRRFRVAMFPHSAVPRWTAPSKRTVLAVASSLGVFALWTTRHRRRARRRNVDFREARVRYFADKCASGTDTSLPHTVA